MFPVSGAAQFSAVGARCGLRPVISASGAYWRLVSPAPYSASGRKRFHRPCLRASAFSSSTTAGVSHGEASCGALLVGDRLGRVDVLVHEGEQLGAQFLGAGVECEVHGCTQPSWRVVRPCSMKTGTRSPIRSKPAPTVWPSV